jgi:hypothetical protein
MKKNIQEGQIVIYKTFWGKQSGIINKIISDKHVLIDDYHWFGDDNKVKYCKIVEIENIIN